MTRKALSLVVLMMSLALAAAAANVNGTWSGPWTDPMGNKHELTLNLRADGNKLTGTIKGEPPEGEEQPIANGKIDGDELSWETMAQTRDGNTVSIKYKAKVNGNQIDGSFDGPHDTQISFSVTKK